MKRVALFPFIIVTSAFLFSQSRLIPVVRVQVYDHVGPIPETLLYTPKQDGLYQIFVHSSVTVPSDSTCREVIRPYLTYSNDRDSKQQTADLSLDISGLPGWKDSKVLIHANAGSIISYRIEHMGDLCDAPASYDFSMTVTLLSGLHSTANQKWQ